MANLSTELLEAFLTTYELGTFTKAAKKLGLTQSALSQKIQKLEGTLETTLLIRSPQGLELTSAGKKILIFAKQQLSLEKEFLSEFENSKSVLAGKFRLAGYSSVTESILIPRLASLIRNNPQVNIEFSDHEVTDLLQVLNKNKADGVVVDFYPNNPGLKTLEIGKEEFVIIESKKNKCPTDIYLDHAPHDNATESYFRFQGKLPNYKRLFMGNVFSIMTGVSEGIGRAVMSYHLVEKDTRFKIIRSQKRYFRPIVLCFHELEYVPRLYQKVIEALSQ